MTIYPFSRPKMPKMRNDWPRNIREMIANHNNWELNDNAYYKHSICMDAYPDWVSMDGSQSWPNDDFVMHFEEDNWQRYKACRSVREFIDTHQKIVRAMDDVLQSFMERKYQNDPDYRLVGLLKVAIRAHLKRAFQSKHGRYMKHWEVESAVDDLEYFALFASQETPEHNDFKAQADMFSYYCEAYGLKEGGDREFSNSPEWRSLRYKVLLKYGRQCMCCGTQDSEMHVDHIKPRKTHEELSLNFDNLQVLCKDCNQGKGSDDDTDFRPSADLFDVPVNDPPF